MTSHGKSSRIHHGLYLCPRMWLGGMVDLDSRMIGSGTNANSRNQLWVWELVLVQALSPSPQIDIHILFPSMECDYPKLEIQFLKFIGTRINVGSENWSKSGKDIGVNINSKMRTESQSWGSDHIHIQVQFYWNENLPICQWVAIDQVQGFVVKLNLSQSL